MKGGCRKKIAVGVLREIIDVHAVCRAPVHKAEAVGDEHLSLADVRR